MSAHDMIDSYLAYLRMLGRSEDYTIAGWRCTLRRADRELPYGLDQADEDDVLRWLGRPGLKPASRYAYHITLRSFYRWATRERDRWLESDPMEHIPPPTPVKHLPRPCSDQELEYILGNAIEPFRTWATLAAYGALRCIEISRLDCEHIEPGGIRLYGKGGKYRVVPTHPVVWEAAQRLPPGPVAVSSTGTRLNGRRVSSESIVYLHKELGMRDMGLHRLRHWCLTNVQRATGDIRVTQEIAGHSSPATTQIYTYVSDARRTAAINALPIVGRAESATAASAPAAPSPPPPPE